MMVTVKSAPRTLAAQRLAAAVRAPAWSKADPASAGNPAANPDSDRVRRAGWAETEIILTSAAPLSGMRLMTAHILQEAERKLLRLKVEARTAAASGDRKAALRIARELAVIAREIVDAAQDYAAAEAQPDLVSPALNGAAARIRAEAPADGGGAIDAGALAGEAAAAAAGAAQAGSATGEPNALGPAGTESECRHIRQEADQGLPVAPPPPDGPNGETLLAKAHRLFEEAMDLLHAMEQLIGRHSAREGSGAGDAPIGRPVWPFAPPIVSASTARPAASR